MHKHQSTISCCQAKRIFTSYENVIHLLDVISVFIWTMTAHSSLDNTYFQMIHQSGLRFENGSKKKKTKTNTYGTKCSTLWKPSFRTLMLLYSIWTVSKSKATSRKWSFPRKNSTIVKVNNEWLKYLYEICDYRFELNIKKHQSFSPRMTDYENWKLILSMR